jgi:hypothetical protein
VCSVQLIVLAVAGRCVNMRSTTWTASSSISVRSRTEETASHAARLVPRLVQRSCSRRRSRQASSPFSPEGGFRYGTPTTSSPSRMREVLAAIAQARPDSRTPVLPCGLLIVWEHEVVCQPDGVETARSAAWAAASVVPQ